MQRGDSCGVVGAVMTGWRLLISPVLVTFSVERCPLWIQSPNRLQKKPKTNQYITFRFVVFLRRKLACLFQINVLIGLIKHFHEIRGFLNH